VLDHLPGSTRNCSHLCIGAAGFKQRDDGRLSKAVEDQPSLLDRPQRLRLRERATSNLAKGRRCDYAMVIENLDGRIRNL
jgi:hypothetical protein